MLFLLLHYTRSEWCAFTRSLNVRKKKVLNFTFCISNNIKFISKSNTLHRWMVLYCLIIQEINTTESVRTEVVLFHFIATDKMLFLSNQNSFSKEIFICWTVWIENLFKLHLFSSVPSFRLSKKCQKYFSRKSLLIAQAILPKAFPIWMEQMNMTYIGYNLSLLRDINLISKWFDWMEKYAHFVICSWRCSMYVWFMFGEREKEKINFIFQCTHNSNPTN